MSPLVVEEPAHDWPDWPLGHAPEEKYESFGGSGELVCSQCVIDPAVRDEVFNIHEEAVCGYCRGTLGPFAEDTVVFEYVYRCLGQEYGDRWHGPLFYDKEEDRHFGIKKRETWEVLNEEDSPFADGSALEQEFEALIQHDWYRLDSQVGEYHERLIWGWESFQKRLIDGPRFLFSLSEAEMGEASARSLFRFLGEFAAEVESGFVKTCEPGQVLYRARAAKKILTSAKKLGSPPPKHTGPQRMSASGVSCFYAAEDPATAKKEVPVKKKEQLSLGEWVTKRPLTYVDFVDEPELPSLFDYPRSQQRPYIFFLREFVRRISQPADPKIGDANAYLATQVLAEHLRFGMTVADRHGIEAVRYPSTARRGGVNWMIFGRPDRTKPRSVKLVSSQPATG
ncbi:RES domain-containing protein [Candidatus Poriferisodalis sp.]|uniref:RES domain-containing protein n=1 Tax=Candidatus Poriferisodalis sp. TaxID=3101277 RepID=UPI003C6EBBBA